MIFKGRDLPVFKAALHTHTTVSDGKFAPAELLKMYAREGFDVFAYTDHKKTNPISSYANEGLTLISGIELHPEGPHGTQWHLLALGVPEDFPGEWESAQAAINSVNASGGVIFCAHPEWCGITSADIAELTGLAGLEVYNRSCINCGKADNETVWNELTDRGIYYPALAVDDTHSWSHFAFAWTMIAAADRSVPALIDALKNGYFYATQGPEFTRLEIVDGLFTAEFTEAEEAVLIGIGPSGHLEAAPDYPRHGNYKLVTKLVQPIEKTWLEGPFRCRIRDKHGHYAWSPVLTA